MSATPPGLPLAPPGPPPAEPAPPAAPPPRSGARRAALTALTALAALTSVASLVLLASTAQDAHLFNELQPWLLLINLAGVVVLVLPDRPQAARARPRLARAGAGLADEGARGADVRARSRSARSWSCTSSRSMRSTAASTAGSTLNVGRGLDDALALSRAALSLRMREFGSRTATLTGELKEVRDFELGGQLDR